MKRNVIFFSLLLVTSAICGMFHNLEFVKGGIKDESIYFNVNECYVDENVTINVYVDFDRIPSVSEGFFIQIRNQTSEDINDYLYRSEAISESGLYDFDIDIDLKEINCSYFTTQNTTLNLELAIDEDSDIDITLKDQLLIKKRILTCMLEDFSSTSTYGENVEFSLQWKDLSCDQIVYGNATILEIKNDKTKEIILAKNQTPITKVFIHQQDLHTGLNELSFTYNSSDRIYYQTNTKYELKRTKADIYTQIYTKNETYKQNETIHFSAKTYYLYNNSALPLENAPIIVNVLYNGSKIWSLNYTTSGSGMLEFIIPVSSIYNDSISKNYTIVCTYDGNMDLNPLDLDIEIVVRPLTQQNDLDNDSEKGSLGLVFLVLGISVSSFSSVAISILVIKNRKKPKKLADLNFRI